MKLRLKYWFYKVLDNAKDYAKTLFAWEMMTGWLECGIFMMLVGLKLFSSIPTLNLLISGVAIEIAARFLLKRTIFEVAYSVWAGQSLAKDIDKSLLLFPKAEPTHELLEELLFCEMVINDEYEADANTRTMFDALSLLLDRANRLVNAGFSKYNPKLLGLKEIHDNRTD